MLVQSHLVEAWAKKKLSHLLSEDLPAPATEGKAGCDGRVPTK